jgi:Icc-related predicted phosphoesterase
LCFFGNDDLYFLKNEVKKSNQLLDENPITIGQYEFKAYGYVPDYPFSLKTACKIDYQGWYLDEPYISEPRCVKNNRIYPIKQIKNYFKKKGTIQQDLQKLTGDSNTIMAFHCPPNDLGLDVCGTRYGVDLWFPRKKVGSRAIHDWIAKNNVPLVLAGHIHESPEVSRIWKAKIGETVVIQPGQHIEQTTMVAIEIGAQIQCEIIESQI